MRVIELETWIDADRAAVFDALTTREGLNAWWGEALNGAEPGGVVEFDHGLGEPLRMRVVELVPGERVVWRCVSEYTDPGVPSTEWLGTRIAFDLAPVGNGPEHAWLRARLGMGPDGTILRFRHAGWADDARWFAFCAEAWAVTLAGLAEKCEAPATALPTGSGTSTVPMPDDPTGALRGAFAGGDAPGSDELRRRARAAESAAEARRT